LATTLATKGWDADAFRLAGLIAPRDRHAPAADARSAPAPDPRPARPSHYDRLRHRLVFPISDALGRPIAFGGRILPDSVRQDAAEAKYLNSPETAVFDKSATLYGIHLAKKPIMDSHLAVIVEGYTDVIACHQAGARNVVGTLGTALTAEHVRQLRKYAEKVVLVFDADEAGQKAADRAVELFLTGDLDVAIAVLPSGEDPDSLLSREGGLAHWGSVLEAASDALSYLFDRMREDLDAAQTITGRQNLAEAYLGRLARMGLARTGSIRRALVIGRLAELLGIGEHEILQILKARAPRPTQESRDGGGAQGDRRRHAIAQAERQVIGGLIQQNELFHQSLPDGRGLDEALTPAEFVTAEHRALYAWIYDRLSDGRSVALGALTSELAGDEQMDLSALAVGADAEVERVTRGRPEQTAGVVTAAAEAILRQAEQRRYEQQRRHVDAPLEAQRLVEHQRANPSPVKIMRAQWSPPAN
jgi:DNA primase